MWPGRGHDGLHRDVLAGVLVLSRKQLIGRHFVILDDLVHLLLVRIGADALNRLPFRIRSRQQVAACALELGVGTVPHCELLAMQVAGLHAC